VNAGGGAYRLLERGEDVCPGHALRARGALTNPVTFGPGCGPGDKPSIGNK
jgi:hypothetical protein